MSDYKNLIEKITADEELKTQTKQMLARQKHSASAKTAPNNSTHKGVVFNRKRIAAMITAAALILSVLAGTIASLSLNSVSFGLNSFSADKRSIVKEIKSRVDNTSGYRNNGEGWGMAQEVLNDSVTGGLMSPDKGSTSPTPEQSQSAGSSGDYAKTNTQNQGVDEGDILKVDDNFIYKLSSDGLTIVNVKNMEVSYKAPFDNFVPEELFIFNDRLIVIGGIYEYFNYNNNGSADINFNWWYVSYQNTRVIVYDLNIDRTQVGVVGEWTFSGTFLTSRLIDNRLVFAVNYRFNNTDVNTYFPRVNSNEINAEDITLYPTDIYTNYAIMVSVDVSTLSMKCAAHLGLMEGNFYWSSVYYISKNNWYFFCTDYNAVNYVWPMGYTGTSSTKIFKIDLETLQHVASGRIDGEVSDRYWADEYNQNLRVVSWVQNYDNWNKSSTTVSILDKNLKPLGKINGIAEGERIFAVRYNGDEGSLVTAVQTDPLFKLDLSNPKKPKISKGLKENGVNMYLQYLSDEVLLGLGRDGTETGAMLGVKVGLYDIRGEDAVLINNIILGGSGSWSDALNNPKAILNDPARNMFSIPITIMDYNNSWKYNLEIQGLAVFEYDLTNETPTLILKGILSNVQNANYENYWQRYDDYRSYITRGARIADKIYTISDKYITSYDADTLELIQRLQIAEFVSAKDLYGG